MAHQVSGVDAGQRRLNGPQTTGRTYRNLSRPEHTVIREDDVKVPTRDGTVLMADVYRPEGEGRFPVLVAASCYPRQIQDIGAPMGFIEAGCSDFFVPRGYVHVIANVRGTGGSGGTYGLFDTTEREDMHDLVEWAAAQPWSDGNVGMVGISYFAMTQLEAASQHPPHLKAIFPVAVTPDFYEGAWHHGLFNSTFITSWLSAVGVAAAHGSELWRGKAMNALRKVLATPRVHSRFEHMNGESAMGAMRQLMRPHYDPHPWDDLRMAASVEHPVRDTFWDERDLLSRLGDVEIPVYLGCDWENVPLHLPGTFSTLKALRSSRHVRVGLLGRDGLTWPWESLHIEALAWFDHWLKGADTGIDEGPAIRYFLPGAEQWRTSESWPPPEAGHRELALRADGCLGETEGEPGARDYLCLTGMFDRTPNMNPPQLPAALSWQTGVLTDDLDIVGEIELRLDAVLSAPDAGLIAVLADVAPDGTAENVTAGWLRASLRTVDEEASRLGAPVLDCRTPVAVPPNEVVSYRIPIVPNARRFLAGHRLRLIVTSDDQGKDAPAMMGFRHPPVTPAVRVSVMSSSRLLIPVVEPDHG